MYRFRTRVHARQASHARTQTPPSLDWLMLVRGTGYLVAPDGSNPIPFAEVRLWMQ